MTEAQIASKLAMYERELRVQVACDEARTNLNEKQVEFLEAWRAEYKRVFTEAGLKLFRIAESANRYHGDSESPHSPAVTITTQIGDIDFYWRKRVCVLDWSKSHVQVPAHELLPDCTDTRLDYGVHCWSYEAAIERLKLLLARRGE